ncbi:MAG: AraC family transcriptional regulator [Lachnospiraceae bacterium]|nr:AraC family transcriptional regulator [Lachnospiraceae bacterium]
MNNFAEETNMDYPVGVYYVELNNMFMNVTPWHWHPELEISFVRSGTAVFGVGEKQIAVKAGSAILINGGHLHSITEKKETGSSNPCVILSILFHPNYLFDSMDSFLAAKYGTPIIKDPEFRYALFTPDDSWGKRGIECINAILTANLNQSYGHELVTKSHLCSFWIQLLEKADIFRQNTVSFSLSVMDEERIKDAITFIQDHYAGQITLKDIADSIHVSKSECCRCFKRAMQISPFDYLLMYRIYASALQMQHGGKKAESIASLAASVGFNNTSYYNKIFKKYLSCTPRQYRETIQKSHRDALNPFGIPLSRL